MYKKETLKNGLRIVTEHLPHVKSAALGFWVKCGSRYEPSTMQGISHFIEHMLFKGTLTRSARDIAEELESVGGVLNAFTGREYSCFYARVLSEHIDLALDILCDMLQNSIFSEDEIQKEKNVVIEEIKMYEDTPDESIHDLFTEVVWNNHPLGKPILGSYDTINNFSRKGIVNYFKDNYIPENIVLSISGNIDHDRIIKKVENMFVNNDGKRTQINSDCPEFNGAFVYKSKELEQTHFCLGVEGLSQMDQDIYTLMILNNILGGGASSRLFQKIREELGLAYSVYSYQSIYKDKGLFTIYAGTSPKLAPQVVKEIIKEITNLQKHGITAAEVERAKAQLKGNLYLSMESTSNRMSRLGRTELYFDRVVTVEEVVNNFQKVKAEEVQELAQKLLTRDKLAFTAYGPAQYKFDVTEIL
ncbi:MAG: hypothetical protein PWQ96_602 [Clostridia bacterium]|nr:hypothetical protein [Clostridia bacterium]